MHYDKQEGTSPKPRSIRTAQMKVEELLNYFYKKDMK